ncbi:MAG: hypothetical protein Q9N02_02740 [Ghiorsea sp.]|nr:hypothetical protein [Ghiorsea sp.]
MASPNFKYAKRQKEIAKQKKNEEKRLRKLEKRKGSDEESNPESDQTDEVGLD